VSAVPRHHRYVPTLELLEGRLAPAGPVPGLRIATYNITSAGTGGIPRDGLGTILEAVGAEPVGGVSRPPDVLALQEVRSQATTTEYVAGLLNGLYGEGVYARGSLDGRTTGTGTHHPRWRRRNNWPIHRVPERNRQRPAAIY
jgi:hypothetical protein